MGQSNASTKRRGEWIRWKDRKYLRVDPDNLTHARLIFVCLHGGRGNAMRFRRSVGPQFENEDALVLYPSAIHSHWNDGRIDSDDCHRDISFLNAIISNEKMRCPSKCTVVLTGMSNGGLMSFRMMRDHFERGKGVVDVYAPVCALLPKWRKEIQLWTTNISGEMNMRIIMIVGMQDTLVPACGGSVGRLTCRTGEESTVLGRRWAARAEKRAKQLRGEVHSLTSTCKVLERMLGVSLDNTKKVFQNERTYTGEQRTSRNGRLRVISIEETGHHWPGSSLRVPSWLLGKAPTFSAGAEIARFAIEDPSKLTGKRNGNVFNSKSPKGQG